jgi:hypothetical protein
MATTVSPTMHATTMQPISQPVGLLTRSAFLVVAAHFGEHGAGGADDQQDATHVLLDGRELDALGGGEPFERDDAALRLVTRKAGDPQTTGLPPSFPPRSRVGDHYSPERCRQPAPNRARAKHTQVETRAPLLGL